MAVIVPSEAQFCSHIVATFSISRVSSQSAVLFVVVFGESVRARDTLTRCPIF